MRTHGVDGQRPKFRKCGTWHMTTCMNQCKTTLKTIFVFVSTFKDFQENTNTQMVLFLLSLYVLGINATPLLTSCFKSLTISCSISVFDQ